VPTGRRGIIFFAPASAVVMLWAAIAAFSKLHEPAWRGLMRLIEHAREEWQRQCGSGL